MVTRAGGEGGNVCWGEQKLLGHQGNCSEPREESLRKL